MGVNHAANLSATAGDVSTMFFGSVSGGLSAELSGGNFWRGAATGLVVSGLNHVAHRSDSKNNYAIEESPGPAGQVEFKDLKDTQLGDFALIGENQKQNDVLITPENDVVYEVDGFYYKNFSDEKYWYKIGNGNKVTVTYSNKMYTFSSKSFSLYGLLSHVGFMPRSEDHWYRPLKTSPNGNPFDCTNY